MCLSLTDNLQNKPGICSAICEDVDGCEEDELCVGPAPDNNNYCFRSCTDNSDCSDGFICSAVDAENGICFVETEEGGEPGGGEPADCESAGCAIYTETDMIDGYCANTPGTAQLCDCPSADIPPSCTPTDPAAMNLYCCP